MLEQVTANIRQWLQGRHTGNDTMLAVVVVAVVVAFILVKFLRPPKA